MSLFQAGNTESVYGHSPDDGLFPRYQKQRQNINMIPLINVVFLLLIFFLVAGRIEAPELIPLDIPQAESGKLMEPGQMTIVLGAHNEILFNDALVEMDVLEAEMIALLESAPMSVITVKADASLESRVMIQVLQAIKRAGGVNISLVTQSS